MNDDDKPGFEHLIFQIENPKDAEAIEALAAKLGKSVPDLMTEAMQAALFRFGVKAGIRCITNPDPPKGPTRPSPHGPRPRLVPKP